MNRRRVMGAVSFPAFLLMWSAAAGLFVAELKSADAMILPAGAPTATLTIEPVKADIADPRAWEAALAELARNSPVMNGDWQPPEASTVPDSPSRRADPVPEVQRAPDTAVPAERQPASAPLTSLPAVAEVEPVHQATVVGAPSGAKVEKAEPIAAGARAAGGRVRKSVSGGVNVLAVRKADARVALGAGQFAAAYNHLRPGVGEARHDTEYLGLLALAALRVGSAAEALVLYQHLVTLEPDSKRWRAGMAFAGERLTLGVSGGIDQVT